MSDENPSPAPADPRRAPTTAPDPEAVREALIARLGDVESLLDLPLPSVRQR